MILDTLENLSLYVCLHPGLEQFEKAFRQYTPSYYPLGKQELDEENAFLILKEYETSSPNGALLEAHNQYWDIMYMLEGEEIVYVKPRNRIRHIVKEYNEQDEALLATLDEDCTPVLLTSGQFLILLPGDAHCPERENRTKTKVKKIIGKLRCIEK